MNKINTQIRILLGLFLLCLAGCTGVPVKPSVESLPSQHSPFSASFSCLAPQSGLQEIICQSENLAALDQEMADGFHRKLRSLDVLGRLYLIHDQRDWLLSRIDQCQVPMIRGTVSSIKTASCLSDLYLKRIAEFTDPNNHLPADLKSGKRALAAYVEFRLSDNLEPALCTQFESLFNKAIATKGEINPNTINGVVELAGSHSNTTSFHGTRKFEVLLHDAGPYAGFQIRAKGLKADGQILLNDKSLPEWISTLPNSGGRFSTGSSQTSDYAAIDIFQAYGREFALVVETWGYYAAAARGEYPHAGLYEISAGTTPHPKCLYRTYLTPPSSGGFDKLPSYSVLVGMLNTMAGTAPEALAPDERRDEELIWAESIWTLLNLPLVAIEEYVRFERNADARFHHDQALERIFLWSERSVQSKRLYRRMLPMIGPAYEELIRAYQEIQGLKRAEAVDAANLVIIAIIQKATENLGPQEQTKSHPKIQSTYVPRYGVIPLPGDLEKGRHFDNLHSVVLNRAPANVVNEFLKLSHSFPITVRGRGADGDTVLMAAVRDPVTLTQLLDAGFDPNDLNDWHKSPLMSAAEINQLDTAEILLKAGSNLNLATIAHTLDGTGGLDQEDAKVSGRTALMYSASSAGEEMVHLLLRYGASKTARDGKGSSACEYLVLNKFIDESERSRLETDLCK